MPTKMRAVNASTLRDLTFDSYVMEAALDMLTPDQHKELEKKIDEEGYKWDATTLSRRYSVALEEPEDTSRIVPELYLRSLIASDIQLDEVMQYDYGTYMNAIAGFGGLDAVESLADEGVREYEIATFTRVPEKYALIVFNSESSTMCSAGVYQEWPEAPEVKRDVFRHYNSEDTFLRTYSLDELTHLMAAVDEIVHDVLNNGIGVNVARGRGEEVWQLVDISKKKG